MEMGTLIDIDEVDMEKIEALYTDAILVNEDLYLRLKEQYQNVEVSDVGKQYGWNDEIKKLFNPKITTLFSYELPDKNSVQIGEYISFLDLQYNGDIVVVKDAFRWSNAYLWLLNVLKENDGCMYFGAISEKLHNSLVSDPKPYRKDVKLLLSNMLNLITLLQMDEIVIDRPNYSQRIRLAENC